MTYTRELMTVSETVLERERNEIFDREESFLKRQERFFTTRNGQ